ncbi:methionine adenosyltransferase [Azoarcus sp. CIB]|nr:methionine adenosyltransferase [Azoarcus sp. CIB]
MVLPGHPDKFCDRVADAVVAESLRADSDAYCQVEVSVWSDQVWLSGGLCTRTPLARQLDEIVVSTGLAIGYQPGNHIDATRYHVTDAVCQRIADPRQWSHHVNDQSIVIGWAGYDQKTKWLPPEHFLAHHFAQILFESCMSGTLSGQGPDGKLMVRIREEGDEWRMEHLLVTLQQSSGADFTSVCEELASVLRDAYEAARRADPRWRTRWDDVELLLNPNGPMIEAGSDGDNGQTGRKLVMDFYGPRVPIGGGALAGKHPTHIDRIGAKAAREAALHMVRTGANECLVRLAYAPNTVVPLDVAYETSGRGERVPAEFFRHDVMRKRYGSI